MTLGRTALTATALVLTLLTGACTVARSDRPDTASSQDGFQEAGAVRYDLSSPPATAQELGVRPGRTSGAFNRKGGPFWAYELVLPEGRVFRTQGVGHVVSIDPAPYALADKVLINSRAADIDAAQAELEAAAPVLGLDAEEVRQWAGRAAAVPLTTTFSTESRVFLGTLPGYLAVDVEVRRDRLDEAVVINWAFTWDTDRPAVTAPPSASASPAAGT